MLSRTQIKTIVLALRNCAKVLEEELGEQSPVLPKRKNRLKEHFEGFYELGMRGKPAGIKHSSKANNSQS